MNNVSLGGRFCKLGELGANKFWIPSIVALRCPTSSVGEVREGGRAIVAEAAAAKNATRR